jgi:hypothetical protein
MRTGLRNPLLLLSLTALWASGCSHNPYLVPAPNAKVVPDQKDAAEAEEFGVHLVVNGNDWRGYPVDLADVISPVEAGIENKSGKSLSIRYKDFSLTDQSGFQSSALPPYTMDGASARAYSPLLEPSFHFGLFWIAPYYYPVFGPGLEAWPGDFPYDPDYYQMYYGFWPGALPTRSMLEQGIPEGVVGDGGHITGFLYFPRVKREITNVSFEFELVDAKTKQSFGTIRIPLIRK